MIPKMLRRFWSEVLIARGELATVFTVARGLRDDLSELVRVTRLLVEQKKLPCFVSGTGVVVGKYGGVELPDIENDSPKELPISSSIAWLAPGDRADLKIQSQSSLGKVVLRVEPPFVLTDVRVGSESKMWASLPNVCREVSFNGCSIGMLISCYVEYPSERPMGRDGFR